MIVTDETGAQVRGHVALRDATPAGTAFLERGLEVQSADALPGSSVTIAAAPEPAVEVAVELLVEPVEEALA